MGQGVGALKIGGAGTPLQTMNKYICYGIIEHNSSLVSFFIPFY